MILYWAVCEHTGLVSVWAFVHLSEIHLNTSVC